MTDSVFNADQGNTQQTTEESIFEIGERKFTKEDAIKKITNADDHIRKIEEDNAELRRKIDEYMGVLAGLQKPTSEPQTPSTPAGLSPEEVAKLVKEQVSSFNTEQTRTANLMRVDQQLQETFGGVEAAGKELLRKSQELGISLEEIKRLSEQAPEAVLSWFKTPVAPNSPNAGGSRNTMAILAGQGGAMEGSYPWWQELKKSDPKKYFSPAMTRKRMEDAQRLGREKFFGN